MSQRLLIPLLSLSLMPFVAAQPQPVPREAPVNLADGLTAREAVYLALRQNLGLLTLRKAREVEAAGVSRARAFSDPEIRFGSADLDDFWMTPHQGNLDLAVRWAPPRPSARDSKGNVALGRVGEADSEIAAAEQRLAADVLLLHTKIVFLDEQISLAEQSVKLRLDIVRTVEEQVEAQAKTAFDLNVAELALTDARSVPAALRTEKLLSLSRLAGELNLSSAAELKIQAQPDPLSMPPRTLDLDALVNRAWSRRAEIAASSARCSQAEAALSLSKGARYPWFSFVQVSREFQLHGEADAWGVRVGVDLPLFKWNQENLHGPVATVERFELERQGLKRRIALEVEQAVTQLRAAYGKVEESRQNVEPLADRDVELAREAVRLGRTDALQELVAGARRLQRRQAYLADLLDCRRLEIELDRATGSAIPD